MFDEASDIQMHGKLNVFVNVCLHTGEVKTLTLALSKVIGLCSDGAATMQGICNNNIFVVLFFLCPCTIIYYEYYYYKIEIVLLVLLRIVLKH